MYMTYRYVYRQFQARLAQSVERQALNLVVEGSSPSVGDSFCAFFFFSFVICVEMVLNIRILKFLRGKGDEALEKDKLK